MYRVYFLNFFNPLDPSMTRTTLVGYCVQFVEGTELIASGLNSGGTVYEFDCYDRILICYLQQRGLPCDLKFHLLVTNY
jgi:hypothetical protein